MPITLSRPTIDPLPMTYQRFEDLPVWQESMRLMENIYAITSDPRFRSPSSFRSQIERAALSVSNNIAEGFERGTTQELLTFIYIARGSAGEVRSMLHLILRHPEWGCESGRSKLVFSLAESCSRQLRAWADNLRNSEIEGQRRLNRKTAAQFDSRKRAEAFRKRTLELLPYNHPLRVAEREKENPEP